MLPLSGTKKKKIKYIKNKIKNVEPALTDSPSSIFSVISGNSKYPFNDAAFLLVVDLKKKKKVGLAKMFKF
jgi:hypothetical protein